MQLSPSSLQNAFRAAVAFRGSIGLPRTFPTYLLPSTRLIHTARSNFPYTTDISDTPFATLQHGRTRSALPRFSSLEAERVYRKEHLAIAFRILHRYGLAEGLAGHCSVRDSIEPDTFWVNPQGKSFARMRQSNLIQCRVEDGDIMNGDLHLPVSAAATSIHSQMYKAAGRGKDDGVESVVHVHSPYTKAFSSLNRTLDMISQDACAFYEQQALVPFAGGVLDNQEGARIASLIGPHHKVAILQNHGLLSVGRLSIDEAVWWQMGFEMCAKAQILADSALRVDEKFIFAEENNILATREELGKPEFGWFSLAPYVEEEEWRSKGEHKL
ncbi:arad-like aldolase/epimerase [Gymnopus androsaceus JB14]|uniref:Arad-like aldolase/epimerase n=1 Tax=Gymnopus androsaceus JB14 TaxID=1447944 RepID=A0A6A4GRC1_9AGAR|nr:arad-like aldolase/epimerase [Gymnopus androsaceus JB14]